MHDQSKTKRKIIATATTAGTGTTTTTTGTTGTTTNKQQTNSKQQTKTHRPTCSRTTPMIHCRICLAICWFTSSGLACTRKGGRKCCVREWVSETQSPFVHTRQRSTKDKLQCHCLCHNATAHNATLTKHASHDTHPP